MVSIKRVWEIGMGNDYVYFDTQEFAVNYLYRKSAGIGETVAEAQRGVAMQHKMCAGYDKRYQSLKRKPELKVEIFAKSPYSSLVSWQVSRDNFSSQLPLSSSLLESLPSSHLYYLVSKYCLFQLKEQIQELKKRRKAYYDAVELLKYCKGLTPSALQELFDI